MCNQHVKTTGKAAVKALVEAQLNPKSVCDARMKEHIIEKEDIIEDLNIKHDIELDGTLKIEHIEKSLLTHDNKQHAKSIGKKSWQTIKVLAIGFGILLTIIGFIDQPIRAETILFCLVMGWSPITILSIMEKWVSWLIKKE